MVGYHINPGGKWSGHYYVLDLKVVQENHDARYIKAGRSGEIIVPSGDFTFPVKEIASGAKAPPVSANKSPEEDAPEAAPEAAAASSSSSTPRIASSPAPAPPPKAAREEAPDVQPDVADAKKEPPKYRAGDWIKLESFDPSRLPKGMIEVATAGSLEL